MLNSYSKYKGTDTTISEKGSPEGVINSARITTAQIACLRKRLSNSRFTTPIADRTAIKVGNSNTRPKVRIVEVNSEIYELRENVLGTSGLT